MKTRLKIIIITLITVIMLVLGLIFAINYKKDSVKYFNDGGYIISNVYNEDTSNVNKIYFSANSKYRSHGDETYSFNNSDGENVKVSEESFVHYNNGSIMSLKNGVAIDLDKIDSKLLRYYNIFKDSSLIKSQNGYEINNLNDTITFNKLMFKISNDKYLIAADNIIVSFSDNQTIDMEGYVEIEYVNENVIRIYNDKVNYQTIASNLYIVIDDIKIDLGYKTISKNNVKYLTMADMVINSNDNIEVLKEPVKPDKDKEDNNNNSNNNNGGGGTGNNQTTPQEPEINLPDIDLDPNEQVDNSTIVQPKFNVESMNVTTLGFENLRMTVEDESNVLYGNRTVEIIENTTGRVVQRFDDWDEGSQIYTVNSYFSLKPNTAYTLTVTGQYKIEEDIYDRTFVSKMFRTLDIGIEITQDFVTSDSLSFNIYKNNYSDVNGFTYSIKDSDGNVIIQDEKSSFGSQNEVVITHLSKFKPNTQYTIIIKDIQYGNAVFQTVSYEALQLTYNSKTLKENPNKNAEPIYDIDTTSNKISLGLQGVNDANGGVITYTYNIYDPMGGLIYSSVKDKYSDLELDIEQLGQGASFYFNVEINFDDNEKNIIYTTTNSDLITTGNMAYPKVVKFESLDEEDIDCESLEGHLVLDDSDSFIQVNKIKNYRILIKEKANATMGVQTYKDYLDIETSTVGRQIYLPVNFKGLKPNTEYVLYVYLEYDKGYIYLGYENAKTKEPDPIYLKIKTNNDNSTNVFAFDVSKGDVETTSNAVLTSINFTLYGCSNSGECEKLNYSRSIPKDQNSDELNDLQEGKAINVNSSEFNFYMEDFNAMYENYKVVVSAFAKDYEIPVRINDTESNEFTLNINDLPPSLKINAVEIPKQDCTEETECYKKNNNKENGSLDDDTIVGFDFKIKTVKNVMGNYVKTAYYKIVESNAEKCSLENITEEVEDGYTSVKLEKLETDEFVAAGNNDEPIKRGTKYCVIYYGTYGDSETSQTDKEVFDLFAPKQPSSISGYIKQYTGTSLTFKLKIMDVDKAIEKIYLSNGKNSVGEEKSDIENGDKEITFNDISGNTNYTLMLSENIGEGSKTHKLYDAKLDTIKNYSDNINIVVDTSVSGKIILKVPYNKSCQTSESSCKTNNGLNKDNIAGLLINSHYLELTDKDESLDGVINLSDISSFGLQIKDGKVEIKDVKLIYDSGEIEDYLTNNNRFFVKSVNGEVGEKYYNLSSNSFSKISPFGIFSTSDVNEEGKLKSKISTLTFSSKVEKSQIGTTFRTTESSLAVLVHFNSAKEADTKLYDTNGQEKDEFQVNETVSTDEIKTVYTTSGAKLSFNITTDLVDGTKIIITIKKKENSDSEETYELTYSNNAWSNGTSKPSQSKIKNVTGSEKNIKVEFDDISDGDYIYSIKYEKNESSTTNKTGYTYNDSSEKENKDITITSLKYLKISNAYSNYSKTYWNWSNAETHEDILFIKKLINHFEVDTSVYELKDEEKIQYEIVAIKVGEDDSPDEESQEIKITSDIKDLNAVLNDKISVNEFIIENIDTFNQKLDGTYKIVLKPKVVTNGSVKEDITLADHDLGNITVTRKDPTMNVTNSQEPVFFISMDDEDGVLTVCSEENLQKADVAEDKKEPMDYINDSGVTKTYFEAHKEKYDAKVVYLTLYGKDGNLIGYSPVPFVYKTSILNLYDYFDKNSLPSDKYKVKLNYCIGDEFKSKEFGEFQIYSASALNIKLVVMPDSYIIVMENPDENIRKEIKRITYQYTTTDNIVHNGELSDVDINENNNITYTTSKNSRGETTYYLGLPLDSNVATTNIRNIEIRFYSSENDEDLITIYSH